MKYMGDNYSTRRRLLRSLGVVGVPLTAGCSGETRPTGEKEAADEVRAGNEGNGTEHEDPEYPDREEINGIPVYRRRYDLAELPIEEWPQYGEDRILPPYCEYPNAAVVDEEVPDLQMNTVTLIDVENDEGHHPLRTARTMMRLVHCYRESDDERYLEKVESISNAFVDVATEQDDALYFPYTFDWTSLGERQLQAPWYGGMSQGAALTAYAHAYEVTGDDHYRRLADRVFRSFTNVRRTTGDVWTTVITGTPTEFADPGDDGPGHFWIEEYPTEPPNHVLNEFGVGLFGLYDYWLHVDREAGYDPLCAALTTVEDHIENYREPGEISWYALSRGFRGNAHYHSTHINQFELLANLSGEERFVEAAETFRDDHPYEEYRPDRRDWA